MYETPTSSQLASDNGDGIVCEGGVQEYLQKLFGDIAGTYLTPFINKRGITDSEYGLRKIDEFLIGNSDVQVDENSDLYIRDKHFKGTPGLWELLTRKNVNTRLVTDDDLKKYEHHRSD